MKSHAFIICWPGKEDYADSIARSVVNHVDLLTVIYSTKDDSDVQGAGTWLKVPDNHYYGLKFAEILKNFQEDIMIQIHADTDYHDWKNLICKLKQSFISEDIGVWAPDFDNTFWDLKSVIVNGGSLNIWDVCQTDCIVWALSKRVCSNLIRYDYAKNNIGWGIDWAAICYCYCNNLRVIRDSSIVVSHHKGTGYGHVDAMFQMELFLGQMSVQERNMFSMLQSKISVNKNAK